MFLEIFFITLLTLLLYFYTNDNSDYWKKKGVSYEKPSIVFFGSFLPIAFGKVSLGKYVEELYHKFDSPYFGFFSFNKPYLVLKDPDLINKILIKDFNVFPNRFFVTDENTDFVMANSLLGIKNPYWKSLRIKLSPVFTSGKMKSMLPLVMQCGENLKDYVETILDRKIEGREIAAKYTTDVIASCAYGISANSFKDNSEFRVAGRKLTGNSFVRAVQSLSYMFAPVLVKLFGFKFFEGEAVEFLREAFQETMRQREAVKIKRNDLIDVLLGLKNQKVLNDDYELDNDRLVAQAILFFFAGHEATSTTIAFTLHELCIHPEIQTKLREEINNVLLKHDGELTYETLRDMNYLHMVISETSRKYPLTPFLQRESVEVYEIPETNFVIDKGTPIIISQHGLQWDPKYFPQPEKYDPERFNDENKHRIPHGVYLPFGDGPRNCIGKRFAFISVKLGIISIVRNFKIERNDETQEPLVFPRADLLQTEKGIRLTFRKL